MGGKKERKTESENRGMEGWRERQGSQEGREEMEKEEGKKKGMEKKREGREQERYGRRGPFRLLLRWDYLYGVLLRKTTGHSACPLH